MNKILERTLSYAKTGSIFTALTIGALYVQALVSSFIFADKPAFITYSFSSINTPLGIYAIASTILTMGLIINLLRKWKI